MSKEKENYSERVFVFVEETNTGEIYSVEYRNGWVNAKDYGFNLKKVNYEEEITFGEQITVKPDEFYEKFKFINEDEFKNYFDTIFWGDYCGDGIYYHTERGFFWTKENAIKYIKEKFNLSVKDNIYLENFYFKSNFQDRVKLKLSINIE